MNVLITGVAGLLGTDLALLLHQNGHGVVGVDNGSRYKLLQEEGFRPQQDNFALLKKAGIVVLQADLLDFPGVGFLGPITHVVHAAAQVCHSRQNDIAEDNITNNIMVTGRLLEEARKRSLPFLFISRDKIYGDKVDTWSTPVTEDCPLGDQTHLTFFGATKMAADLLAQMYARQYGMTVGCLRPGCFTGPYALATEAQNWLPWLIHCAKGETTFRIFGDGTQVRDLLDSKDLAQACMRWCERPTTGVWNIGGGEANVTTLNGAVVAVEYRLKKKIKVEHCPSRQGDIHRLVMDNNRFSCAYSWRPKTSLDSIFTEALR